MSAFDAVGFRLFLGVAQRTKHWYPKIGESLDKATSEIVPVAFIARAYFIALVSTLSVGLLTTGLLVFIQAPGLWYAFLFPAMLLTGLMALMATLYSAVSAAEARRKDIEEVLPSALTFIASLANAGVVPTNIFKALSESDVYGEIAVEAGRIYRDINVFAKDMTQALQDATLRCPSPMFEEFLSGALTTASTGGDLKGYFLGKAEHFADEQERLQRKSLEGIGIMAESYVVVAAAAPLFLIVTFSVLILISSGLDPRFLITLLSLAVMPVIHAMFAWLLSNLTVD